MAHVVGVVVAASVLLMSLGVMTWKVSNRRLSPKGIPDGTTWRKFLVRLGASGLAKVVPRALLQRRIGPAGDHRQIEFFLGLKLAVAVSAIVLFGLSALVVPTLIVAAPVAAIAAFQLPEIVLARRAKARRSQMSHQVPDLADVLLVMTDAGLSPAVAFRRAAGALPEPLGPELGAVIQRLELGVPWRSAVAEVAERTGVEPLKRLLRALTRSQRLGTSLATGLRTLADDLRAERRAQAEMLARQAPVKMLFPLVFLILPAFLLLTVGPVVLSTMRSLQ